MKKFWNFLSSLKIWMDLSVADLEKGLILFCLE